MTARTETRHNDTLPFISIVMPVRNEERFIADTLFMLLSQDYPADRYEILVVDGMSTDSTSQIVGTFITARAEAQSGHPAPASSDANTMGPELFSSPLAAAAPRPENWPAIRLLTNEAIRSSSGRNIGFKYGKGEYFLVVDGHCHIPTRRLLHNVSECFVRFAAQCLGRPQPLTPPDLTPFQHTVALARASAFGHGGGSYIFSEYEGPANPTSNGAAYHRDVFSTIGYVDESFDACEDVEFNFRLYKAGIPAATSPSLTVNYYPRETVFALFGQMRRYGYGRWRLACKHPDSVGATTLVPAAFVCMMASLPLCLLAAAYAGSILPAIPTLAGGMLYTLLIVGESIRIIWRTRSITVRRTADNSQHISSSTAGQPLQAEPVSIMVRTAHTDSAPRGIRHGNADSRSITSSSKIGSGVPPSQGYLALWLPVIFATVHCGLGWGFIKGMLHSLSATLFASSQPQRRQA